jgi:short-subunit dehydrogenase
MGLSFHGKIVIVTGASQGIGAKLVSGLRGLGANVVLTARDESAIRANATQDDLVVPGDITVASTREEIVARTLERFGRIDGLVNNAGRGSYYTASASPLEDSREMFELNFFAPMHLAQLATPSLKESKGSLVNVCSIAAQISLAWLPVYSASKFALAALSSAQSMELRRNGVHVMTVLPGYVDTAFQAHAGGSAPPGEVVKGRKFAVSPEECAAAIIKGMAGRSRIVVTPRIGWPLVIAGRLFPVFIESRMELR